MNVTHPIHVNMEIVSTPLGVSSALALRDLQILIVARVIHLHFPFLLKIKLNHPVNAKKSQMIQLSRNSLFEDNY